MARIRTIKPEFWSDEDVAEMPFQARLLFIATWNLADDEGLLKWSPQFLKGQVFPYDDVTTDGVRDLMRAIEQAGFVHPYKDGKGKVYGWIVNFRKHQKINKPQPPKHPVPSLQNAEVRARYAERDDWCCHLCGEAVEHPADVNHLGLSLDHIIPQANGGTDCPSNIRIAHKCCNSRKKDRSLPEEASEREDLFQEHSGNAPGIGEEHSVGEGKGTGNREQGKEDSSLRSESRAPALLDCGPTEPDEVGQAVADWNDMASDLNLPKVQKLNPQRKARLKARLREAGGIEGWRHALGKIRGSPFLRGERGKWSASFDFLLQEQSFTRLMEGTYDDRQPAQQDAVADRRNDITELIGERYPEYRRAS